MLLRRLLPLMVLVSTAFLSSSLIAFGQADYTPERLGFTIYLDGSVQVEYIVSIDPLLPAVNVTLFGRIYDNLLVQDDDKTPVDHRLTSSGATIFTLGSPRTTISYSTQDLVNKSGRIWTFSASPPLDFSIVFPREATIISLSSVPLTIGVQGGQHSLLMRLGSQQVSYITGILGTREVSTLLINKAKSVLDDAKAQGRDVQEAEAKLKEAEAALRTQSYQDAERLATAAIDLASKTVSQTGLPTSQVIAVAAVVAGATLLTAFYVRRRTAQKMTPPYVKRMKSINVSKILEVKPYLRLEDREVIQVLAEMGGEAFESELRERFKLPKTTVWRMMKRLQREGIAEIVKMGGQNLIRLKEPSQTEE